MSTMRRQSVSLSIPQHAVLQQQATRMGISVSDLLRRIVDERLGLTPELHVGKREAGRADV